MLLWVFVFLWVAFSMGVCLQLCMLNEHTLIISIFWGAVNFLPGGDRGLGAKKKLVADRPVGGSISGIRLLLGLIFPESGRGQRQREST